MLFKFQLLFNPSQAGYGYNNPGFIEFWVTDGYISCFVKFSALGLLCFYNMN